MGLMVCSVLFVVFVVILDLTTAVPAESIDKSHLVYRDNYAQGQCYVNGYVYSHGQVFSIRGFSRCLKYRCVNGGWDIFEEGCEHNGACHPVNSDFEDDCITYRCTKSNRNGYIYYQPINIRTRCQDYHRSCRDPGTQFPYAINGRYYERCSCTIHEGGFTRYSCTWG